MEGKNIATAKSIRKSLIEQLEKKRANIDLFLGLIDDYIWYYNEEKAMQKDIKKRGRTYMTISAAGKEYEKDNPSVKNAVLYNKQKLSILKDLGLNTDNVIGDDEDDEEL